MKTFNYGLHVRQEMGKIKGYVKRFKYNQIMAEIYWVETHTEVIKILEKYGVSAPKNP